MGFWSLALACVAFTFLGYAYYRPRRSKEGFPLPPGPPRHWLLGNHIPTSKPHLQFEKWTKIYGPVFSLQRGSDIIIVIGRQEAAIEIMEKEGASVADRPHFISAGETMSGGMRTLFVHKGPRLNKLRKSLHLHMQPKLLSTYEPLQLLFAKKLAKDILHDPDHHQSHTKSYSASIIMSLTYGKTTPSSYTDPHIISVLKSTHRVASAGRPGQYLVDTFPFLRWVPFYLSQMKEWHKEELGLFLGQLRGVRDEMTRGEETPPPSFAKYLLENQTKLGLSDEEAAYLAGSMFGAGSDTTASALSVVIMAAAVFPEAQKVVQDELDRVVGRDRCPNFEDDLPQVTAFYLECYRWRPVSVGGFPHRATKDIIWHNYLIPAGSTVIGNHWSIMRSPSTFPNPEQFNPQRWIGGDGRIRDDLKNFNFGFGRRVCPGFGLANRSLQINTSILLWAFNILQNPNYPIDIWAFTDSGNTHPLPFKAVFELRVEREVVEGM